MAHFNKSPPWLELIKLHEQTPPLAPPQPLRAYKLQISTTILHNTIPHPCNSSSCPQARRPIETAHSFNFSIVTPLVVRTRGTSPQLRTHIGGRTKRRRPNLWPYGWSILVIGLDIKQARTFIDQGFFRVSLCIFIVGYLNTFSDYCKTVFENYKKTFVFFHWCRLQFAWC